MTTKVKLFIIHFLQVLLYLIPVKKNRIMFYANNRKGYVCNPAALLHALLQSYPDEYEFIWVTRFPDTCEPRKNITVVRQRSLRYFLSFIRTKFFITNDMVDEALIKKRGQIFLNTWHGGGAYKKVGTTTITEDAEFAKNFHKWYGRLDYFVSSCQMCTDTYTEAFHLSPHAFLETGTPRNDIFFEEHNEIRERVRDFYHLSHQTRIILFAPSFQMSAPEKENYDMAILSDVARQLQKNTGEPWLVLYRSHYFREDDNFEKQSFIADGNRYYEMQDLLYTADILVTDFSSCVWDFILTGRPIIVMENRLREYEKEDRGFFVPYQEWPFLKIETLSELTSVIVQYKDTDFTHAYMAHTKKMGSFETGTSCRQIINTIIRGAKK